MASRSRQTRSIERNGLKRPGVRALQQPFCCENSSQREEKEKPDGRAQTYPTYPVMRPTQAKKYTPALSVLLLSAREILFFGETIKTATITLKALCRASRYPSRSQRDEVNRCPSRTYSSPWPYLGPPGPPFQSGLLARRCLLLICGRRGPSAQPLFTRLTTRIRAGSSAGLSYRWHRTTHQRSTLVPRHPRQRPSRASHVSRHPEAGRLLARWRGAR